MKKFVSVLLTLALLTGICTVAVSAETDGSDLRIAVASDLHYNVPREALAAPPQGTIDDDIYWYANRRAAMEDESGFIIDAFLKQCAESDIEYILIPGDLADNGKTILQQHIDVAAKFAKFEKETGKQIFVINGNHDFSAWENETHMEDFKRIYADFGFNEALTADPDSCSYTANLGDKYRLIAVDSCDYSKSTEDGLTLKRLNFVKRETANAKKDGRYPIVMMHHNLIDHMPIQRIINRNFIVRFHYSTAELFANWGVRVVLTGHEHCSDTAVYTSKAGNKIYDFATTALTMYPLAYREMSFTEQTVDYTDVTIDSIDTDALQAAVSGYSERQIALMNEDLNAYAKGFLKAGVEFRLWLSLSLEKMGIKETDFYYNAANALFGRLNELLKMPLYGENSVQALAEEYNITLPASDYTTAWDIATEFVAMHYAGEENYGPGSTEMTLFMRVVNLILHDDLAHLRDETLWKGANKILADTGLTPIASSLNKLGCQVFGSVSAGEFFLLTLLAPFLYEFVVDTDGVNDNHGSIEGYGVNGSVKNVFADFGSAFSSILVYMQNFFFILSRVLRIAY